MIGVVVCPRVRDVADAALGAPGPTDAGWLTTGLPDEGCAFCQIGCCVQRLIVDPGTVDELVLHGMLGEA